MNEDRDTKSFGSLVGRRKLGWTPGAETAPYIGLEHIPPYQLRLVGIGTSDDVASNKTRFLSGDVLFGKLRPYFQKIVRPTFDGVCSTDIWALYSLDQNILTQNYLHWIVADPLFSDFANSAETGTRMPRANWTWVENYVVELPTLKTQNRITEVLDTIDELANIAESVRTHSASAAQLIVATAEASCSVSQLAATSRKQWNPATGADQLVDHYSLPAYDTRMEPDRVLGSEVASNKLQVAEPSVLFSRLNPSTNRTWLCHPSDEADISVCSTEYAVLRPLTVSVETLWATLSSGELGEQLAVTTTGTSASHQRVNEDAVMASIVADPRSLSDVERDEVEVLMDVYVTKTRELRNLYQTRDFLLPRLISGELRVQSAEELVELSL
jgi:hypothetical protein